MFQLVKDLNGQSNSQPNAKQDTMLELNVAGIHVSNVKLSGSFIKGLEMIDGLQTEKGELNTLFQHMIDFTLSLFIDFQFQSFL